jgi:hypothetical protein
MVPDQPGRVQVRAIEAAERFRMLSNPDGRRPRAAAPGPVRRVETSSPAAPGVDTPTLTGSGDEAGSCDHGGLEVVLNGSDLNTASAHFQLCTACQHEFVDLGGLLPRLGAATPRAS